MYIGLEVSEVAALLFWLPPPPLGFVFIEEI